MLGSLSLLVGSLGLMLVAAEFAVRTLAPQPVDFRAAVVIEPGDELSPQARLRRAGATSEEIDRTLAASGRGPHLPFEHLRVTGVDVRINSRGWRDVEAEPARAPGNFRALVLGDSVVFGYGVELTQTFHKRAQVLLSASAHGRDVEVLGFSRLGQTLYETEAILPLLLDFYKPDAVVIALNLNDVLERPPPGQDLPLSPWLRAIRRLRFTADGVFYAHSHLYFLVRDRAKRLLFQLGYSPGEMIRLAALHPDDPASRRAFDETLASLAHIVEASRARRVLPVALWLPVDPQLGPEHASLWRDRYRLDFSDSFAEGRPQDLFQRWALEHHVPSVEPLPDLREAARRGEGPFFFREAGSASDWNHPNAAGHERIGRMLAQRLQEAFPELR
ncbi:MAG: hypothetical protein IT386_14815 [Deltaproteobacteria bacterium]|nr:hypothetical protein [Deltaproteobacteria bacterium]